MKIRKLRRFGRDSALVRLAYQATFTIVRDAYFFKT